MFRGIMMDGLVRPSVMPGVRLSIANQPERAGQQRVVDGLLGNGTGFAIRAEGPDLADQEPVDGCRQRRCHKPTCASQSSKQRRPCISSAGAYFALSALSCGTDIPAAPSSQAWPISQRSRYLPSASG